VYGLSAAQQQDWLQRAIALFDAMFPYVEFENWQKCEYLVPHVQAIALRLETTPVRTLALARLFNQTGHFLDDQGRYSEAEFLCAIA
jgi:hypothetical protein